LKLIAASVSGQWRSDAKKEGGKGLGASARSHTFGAGWRGPLSDHAAGPGWRVPFSDHAVGPDGVYLGFSLLNCFYCYFVLFKLWDG
jgi:hypothetical protein